MSEGIDIDAFFSLIKKNHGLYLRDQLIKDHEASGNLKDVRLIKDYVESLSYYRTNKEHYLNLAIRRISTNRRGEVSALSALLNIGVGKIATDKLNELNPQLYNFITSFSGAEEEQDNGSAFSQLLKASMTLVAVKEWEKINNQSAIGEDFNQFQKALYEAGFTHQKYELLSIELLKLFHFRECILLGLEDNIGVNLREDFIEKYTNRDHRLPINKHLLNKAINLYFDYELNKLFNKGFAEIYTIQDEAINQEREQTRLYTWIKHFFAKPESRYQFSLQLQIHFISECINFLEIEKNQLGTIGRHPYLSSFIVGLIGAIFLTLIVSIFNTNSSLLTMVGIIGFSFVSLVFYGLTRQVHYLKYKRDKRNRAAITNTIDNVNKSRMRLRRLLNTVETDSEDIEFLNKYKERNNTKRLVKFSNTQVALGSIWAWLREHASRYRHSKGVEIDLAEQHKVIIERSFVQTSKLQKKIVDLFTSKLVFKTSKRLNFFITNTRMFLLDDDNQEFITKFELIEKIKQQVLEIVAVIPPPNQIQKNLPKNLEQFYTDPIAQGGLGGHSEDLIKVRELAFIVQEGNPFTCSRPFRELIHCAHRVNHLLTQDPNYLSLFLGDNEYREKLGLSINQNDDEWEVYINLNSIKTYLENSYHFLYSLNPPVKPDPKQKLDTVINNTNEFVLYRMLLLKQLAELSDPNNQRIDNTVKQEIFQFVRERLFLDPMLIFDDFINQTLFNQSNEISFVADALRMHLAYSSKPITPRMILTQEAKVFSSSLEGNKLLLCFGNSVLYLTPESSANYLSKIHDAIGNTKSFIAYLNTIKMMKDSRCYDLYVENCLFEIERMCSEINALTKLLKATDRNFNSLFLQSSHTALIDLKKYLSEILPLKPIAYSPEIEPKKTTKIKRQEFKFTEQKSEIQFFHRRDFSLTTGGKSNRTITNIGYDIE